MERMKKVSGFSLIELVIVIIILGILSFAAFINWDVSTSFLDQQTEIVAGNLRYTQSLSMAKNRRCRFVITSATSYKIQDNKGNDLDIPPGVGVTIANLDNGITFVLPPSGFTNTMRFNGKGVPYTDTPNISKLTTNATLTLTDNAGHTRTITITPRTGRISTS